MSFDPRPGQEMVLDASDPVLIVLGGAGTGKTTVAAAAVRRITDEAVSTGLGSRRGLFLSFSRSAVAQIIDRPADILGPQAPFVEITTFHAFAWHLIVGWGAAIGLSTPTLISPSEAKLFGSDSGITYNELLPLSLKLLEIPAIRRHFERRWAVIVSDEFQDTSDEQYELIMRIRGNARLLFLGDPNQCIYSNLPGVVGVGLGRFDAARALPGAREIRLPDVSHRDPTNILPAAAAAIRERVFGHDAVMAALETGMLEVRHEPDSSDEGRLVAGLVGELREAGFESVGIFSHHIDATASLSDDLNREGITHEIVGLPDSIASALQAQFEMLCYAADCGTIEAVWRALGVFITSTERGSRIPELAQMIIGNMSAPLTLSARLEQLDANLKSAVDVPEVLAKAARVPDIIGLTRGWRAWDRSAGLLRTLLGPRLCRLQAFPQGGFDILRERLEDEQASLLTYSESDDPADIQLMGLYQSKGREADATIVVLRGNDYFGKENEPMPIGSKLVYVVLTRARKKTVILVLGSPLPSLIEPLATLAAGVETVTRL